MDAKLNVLGEELAPCSENPVTGYYRDGCCNTEPANVGSHTVCIRATAEFLAYSRSVGNDLTTQHSELGFWASAPAINGAYAQPIGRKPWMQARHREWFYRQPMPPVYES